MSPLSASTPESRYTAFRDFLRRRLPDSETAEDILQQNLLKALEDGGWNEKENPTAWFYRVLRNAVADFYRARAVRARGDEALAMESASVPVEELQHEACECFRNLLPGLKAEYADALRAIDLEGGVTREVAARAGVSPENMAVRLHRARRALRTQLQEACGMCSTHGCLNCSCGH